MNLARTLARAAAVPATALLLVPAFGVAFLPDSAPAAAATRDHFDDTVLMSVAGMSPSVPTASRTPKPLTVRLTLVNTTDAAINHVSVIAERGYPISTQTALDKALADPTPPPSGDLPIPATHPQTVDLPAGATVNTTFETTTSTLTDAGLCICSNASQPLIYPLYFSAHVSGAGNVDQRLGVVATYLPSFYQPPAPVHVSWIWPLIDRPHRLTDATVFTDDLLKTSVSTDGRLDRALQVVEDVGGTIPLTLVVDPELLAELQVMASGHYSVVSGSHRIPGTGKSVAADWLDRLRVVLADDPGVQLELTPYADPDVESLSAHGLDWATGMPAAMRTVVHTALGGQPTDSTVSWPAAGALSAHALQALAATGVSTVVLDSSAVTAQAPTDVPPAGLARLQAHGSDVAAALTTAPIEKYAAQSLTLGGPGVGALPQLVAELAVLSAQQPDVEHVATIAAPRYVNPSVSDAVHTITDTSTSTFARPISLRDAVSGRLLPTGRSTLAKVPARALTLPDATIAAANDVASTLPTISSLLDHSDAGVRTLLSGLPVATQRAESSAFRHDHAPVVGIRYAHQLTAEVDAIPAGVQIVRPSSGSYTLASSTSPLPITVDNGLAYPVRIRISVTTAVNGVPGFTTKNLGVQRVDANQKRTLNLPTRTERPGLIRVQAVLLTPDNVPLGDPVPLTVRSTALGVVGVVITVVAGVVLVIALLIRLIRRIRKRSVPPVPKAVLEPTP